MSTFSDFTTPLLIFLTLSSLAAFSAADWNILKWNHYRKFGGFSVEQVIKRSSRTESGLRSYCEGWRYNVEVNNIRGFEVVPRECVDHIKSYMTSSIQYDSDSLKMVEEVKLYLASAYCKRQQDHDSKVDAWVFDVDDTLLSTIPYFNSHAFGEEKLNETSLEAWMRESKAPALNYSLRLFHTIKDRGIKIFIISSRREHLRSATVDNLIGAGYHGWSGLILRPESAAAAGVAEYKAEARKRFVVVEQRGYHILGIVGDQWSSIVGPEAHSNSGPFRAFKLPNPVYYVS